MQISLTPQVKALVHELVLAYSSHSLVDAVAIAGSLGAGTNDELSDLDIYVYSEEILPNEIREKIVLARSNTHEVGNNFWEPGDEWIEKGTGMKIDAIYRTKGWIEKEIAKVLERHEASVGYSTCFWYNVQNSIPVYDREAWFAQLQDMANQTYPERLKSRIIAKNLPILRSTMSSYASQIKRAIDRSDLVSVNHRIAAFLASYFDILLAINHLPHPGEKRLLKYVQSNCNLIPKDMETDILEMVTCQKEGLNRVIERVVDKLESII